MRPLVLLGLLLAGSAVAAPPELVPGHVVVKFRGTPRGIPGARLERQIDRATHLLHAGDESDAAMDALVAKLARDPDVAWVEREHIRRRSTVISTDDPLFDQQWPLSLTHITSAWSRTEGSEAVTVAVVDSGIRQHPDLQDRYVAGFDFISDPANADDSDGVRDNDPTDTGTVDPASSQLHGMHVAGILGAHTDNAVGIAGVDWNCQILPVRVLGVLGGQGSDTDIADGIRWAAGIPVDGAPTNPTPAQVINLSFGGPGGSAVLQSAIDDVASLGVIVVAAAGNDGADTAGYAPAGLNHVIAVGAGDGAGNLASYSNRGPRVDLLAPGGDLTAGFGVLSTLYTDADGYTYVAFNGTSQAAPHVSGVASLMKALDPSIDSDRARTLLSATADPSHACAEGCGGGLLDADAALAAVQFACADGHCQPPGAYGGDLYNAGLLGKGCNVGGNRSASLPALLFIALSALLLRRRARV
jgi:serine protease